MELVPIIYSSLLFVFSLLSIILIISFTYSKLFSRENSNVRVRASRNVDIKRHSHISTPAPPPFDKKRNDIVARNERSTDRGKREIRKRTTHVQKVEKTLIEDNKVRIVSNSSRSSSRSKRMRSDYVNSVSRYSVVNNLSRERKVDSDLYAKFQKMSVEYSQTA